MYKVTDLHTPVVTHKPFHHYWPQKLNEGHPKRFSERLHDVPANVIHGAVLDKRVEEPKESWWIWWRETWTVHDCAQSNADVIFQGLCPINSDLMTANMTHDFQKCRTRSRKVRCWHVKMMSQPMGLSQLANFQKCKHLCFWSLAAECWIMQVLWHVRFYGHYK